MAIFWVIQVNRIFWFCPAQELFQIIAYYTSRSPSEYFDRIFESSDS